MLLPSWPPTVGLHSWGGSSSQNLLLPPGGLGRPQLCGPVGKRAAVCRQHTAVRVVTEEPAGAGLESFREEFPLCFRVPLPLQLLFPPVANVNPPIQNCVRNKEKTAQVLSSKSTDSPGPGKPQLWGSSAPAGRRRGTAAPDTGRPHLQGERGWRLSPEPKPGRAGRGVGGRARGNRQRAGWGAWRGQRQGSGAVRRHALDTRSRGEEP